MLVPDLLGLEVLLVGGLVDLLEDILESTIVLLEDGVLGAHVERKLLVKSQLEGSVSETSDGLVGVVLGLSDTAAVLELEDLNLLRLATLGGVNHGELTGAGQDSVLGAVLVTKGVTANDDRLLPARNKTGNAGDDNGLTEDGTTKGISDGSVGGKPHWTCKLAEFNFVKLTTAGFIRFAAACFPSCCFSCMPHVCGVAIGGANIEAQRELRQGRNGN